MGNTNGDQSGQHSSQGYIVGTGDRCVHSERPRSRKDSTAFLIQSPKVHILLTSSKAQMSILLSPPSLLLLLAALVAPATSTTNYRPDWNRLRGLARGRVETCGG